jgi:YidC/Oxa1 family membrane protein insertase
MEKRAIIAVVLSIAFFYGYYLLFPPPKVADKQPVDQTAVSTTTVKSGTLPAPVQPIVPQPVVQTPQLAAKDIVVETDLYKAVFSNQGASLKSFTLKQFRETNKPDGKLVALINETRPSEYMLKTAGAGFALSPAAIYNTSAYQLIVSKDERKPLVFVYTSPQGFTVKKTYTFSGNSYALDLDTQILNNGTETLNGTLDLVLPYHVEGKDVQSRFEVSGSVALVDDKLKVDALKDTKAEPIKYQKALWAGFADKYFLNAVLSKNDSIESVSIRKSANNYIESTVASPVFALQPGQSHAVSHKLFFGPKDVDILKAQGSNLEQVLDLGWFSALARPLLYTLKYFYQYTHNYGIAIIIITVILKILFFPLTHKSYKSMKEMQKLQPKMLELKEKYKDDREALNRSTMELYKTHKVNPLGGCLPMVVQIPVFFALYKALMFSIELRHAPFMLWITDLAAKDPYYVTPIVMGATMFIQQKMTPSTMDPMQAKMMLALPVVFTFMFLNFPSGLVIYWLVNNILTIAQQAYINKIIK